MAPLFFQTLTEVDDSVSVATGATFSVIMSPDGIRCCRKHPHMQLKDGIFACPACDSDFLQNQAMLKQKKDSLLSIYNQIEKEGKKENNINPTMMVLRSPSQQRTQDDKVSETSYTAAPQRATIDSFSAVPSSSREFNSGRQMHNSTVYDYDFSPPFTNNGNMSSSTASRSSDMISSFPSTMVEPSSVEGRLPPQQTNHSSFSTIQQRQQYPFDAFTMQMQRMQHMQDWMLMKKEQEAQTLRKQVEEQNQALHKNAIQLALLRGEYQYQEDRMEYEIKLSRYSMAQKEENVDQKGEQWQKETPVEPPQAQSLPISSANFTSEFEHPKKKGEENMYTSKPRNTKQPKGYTPGFQMIGIDIDVNDTASNAVPSNEELTLGTLMQRQISWIASKGGDRFKPRYIPQATSSQQDYDDKAVVGVSLSSTNIDQYECDGNKQIKQKLFKNQDQRDNRPDLNTLLEDQSVTGAHTVASSTYGEERSYVDDKSILDPYGYKCTFTGPILKSTKMPHGKGKMIYKKDKQKFEGQWRHGRLYGF